jgi:hypothetical protein
MAMFHGMVFRCFAELGVALLALPIFVNLAVGAHYINPLICFANQSLTDDQALDSIDHILLLLQCGGVLHLNCIC